MPRSYAREPGHRRPAWGVRAGCLPDRCLGNPEALETVEEAPISAYPPDRCLGNPKVGHKVAETPISTRARDGVRR
ncbi:hypothetical protein GCM10009821_17690 [Aeromicrobium halocynthiae]|uniref:Uncharacterized protein n=1 Tax=Aeromicrobium halocynthiae TaxID=560557 RepID=A0ABN2W041_9ACTN